MIDIPNRSDIPKMAGKPQAHFIGDIPRVLEVVEVCRQAAKKTGWFIFFMLDHPQHPPNRITIWSLTPGNQRPFWECWEDLMRKKYGPEEWQWPQGPAIDEGPPPPRSSTRYFHS